MWPTDADALIERQQQLAAGVGVPLWQPPEAELAVAGCWVCFPRGLTGPGSAGDRAWAAAALMRGTGVVEQHVAAGVAGAPYVPGLLALRIGPLLEGALRGLRRAPDVVLVDGTGRDHPRRAGLALHLGAELDLPSVGVTHRPLAANGEWPDDRRGAVSDLRLGGDVVARWVRTRAGTRPLVVHPGWRTDVDEAVDVVLATTPRRRTPEPLRAARHLAREERNATGSEHQC
jgi:deoxyribonuclease V